MKLDQYLRQEELDRLRAAWPAIPGWQRRLMRIYAQTVLTLLRACHRLSDILLEPYKAHWIIGGTDERVESQRIYSQQK